jgi:hypothetical protein
VTRRDPVRIIAWLAVALGVFMAGAILFIGRLRTPALPTVATLAVPAPEPSLIDDPIAPDRPLRVAGERADTNMIAGAGSDARWVTARPAKRLQSEKPASERGGVDPCNTPKAGFGGYGGWKSADDGWRYLVPESGGVDAQGRADVVLHFHGHEVARKGFVRAGAPLVLFGTSAESGAAYREKLAGSESLDRLLASVETKLSQEHAAPVTIRRLALTAWSGGYEAIGALLENDAERIDAVVLLDGLHASRERARMRLQLEPFVRYASRAAAGNGLMIVTHSSIDPPTFASSTETAHYLIDALGGRPLQVRRDDLLGLELIEAFSRGNFHVRGYAGGGEADHCAHLGLMEDAMLALARYWKLGS